MSKTAKLLEAVRNNPSDVRFDDLRKICEKYFGKHTNSGTSHYVYPTPWKGDPRINIQNKNGKAKRYQVIKVIEAIDKLQEIEDESSSES